MNNRRSLKYAYWFCQILIILVIAIFGLFFIAILYSLMNTDALQNVILEPAFRAEYGFRNIHYCTNCADDPGLRLNELSTFMKLWLLIRLSIFAVLTYLILHRIKQIIHSVRSISTFYKGNIKYFNQLFTYGLVMTFFSAFNFFIHKGEVEFHFNLPFGVIGFTLACWVLADIFKEGKALLEEQKSII